MTDEYINFEELKYWHIDDPQGSDTSNYILDDGDLLISFINSQAQIGKTSIFFNKINRPCIYTTNILRAKPSANLDLRYFFYVTKTKDYDDYIQSITKPAVNQASFTTKDFQKYKFQLPPLPEQKKIARILSTWDNAISATKRLLENSQQRKKALMQQLLTGKKRLPGFEGEWRLKTLNDLYSFKRGKGLSKDLVIPNGKNKCVLYGELYTKYGEVISSVISKTDSHDGLLSIAGDVLLPSSTTTTGIDLANATAVLEDEVLLGGDIIVLRPKELLDPIFMSHLLTHVKKHEIAVKAQGITKIHLYGSDLKKIAVNIPENYDEQKAIVKVLTTAYQENELLQKRLDHLRLEKKALMQQLLTGKRRVVVDTDAA